MKRLILLKKLGVFMVGSCLMSPAFAFDPLLDVLQQACPELQGLDDSLLTDGQRLLKQRCANLFQLQQEDPVAFQNAIQNLSPTGITAQSRAAQVGVAQQSRNVSARTSHLRRNHSPKRQSAPRVRVGGSAGENFSRLGAFLNSNQGSTDKDTTDAPGYDSDLNGWTAGLDYRFSSEFVAGAAFGRTDTTTEYAGKSQGELDSSTDTAMLYGSLNFMGWSIDAVAGKGQTETHTERIIAFSGGSIGPVQARPEGDTDSRETFFYLATQYDFFSGGWNYAPIASVEAVKTRVDAFGESQGGGFGIGYAEQEDDTLSYELGGRVSYTLSQSWGVLIPEFRAGWHHYANAQRDAITARLLFGDIQSRTFQIEPEALDENFQLYTFNTSAVFSHGISAFVEIEVMDGYQDYSAQQITAGLRAEL